MKISATRCYYWPTLCAFIFLLTFISCYQATQAPQSHLYFQLNNQELPVQWDEVEGSFKAGKGNGDIRAVGYYEELFKLHFFGVHSTGMVHRDSVMLFYSDNTFTSKLTDSLELHILEYSSHRIKGKFKAFLIPSGDNDAPVGVSGHFVIYNGTH